MSQGPELVQTQKELERNPGLVAQQQLELGSEWADMYATSPSAGAEIVLRNPVFYLTNVGPGKLPDTLQEQWEELNSFSDNLVSHAVNRPVEWNPDITGLAKLQHLMASNGLNLEFRGSVADVMRRSSVLFSQSTEIVPGNTEYYAGNIRGMAARLNSRQKSA